jgi:tetratricopeptide (TPR) repeat protein
MLDLVWEGEMKSAVGLLILLALLSVQRASAATPGYAVSQSDNLVIVKTPWGSSIFLAPVGFDNLSSYSFEVPLSNFRSVVNSGSNPPGFDKNSGTSDNETMPLGSINALISEANRLYNQGEFSKALQYVDQISIRDPQNVRGWIMKGSLMHILGHHELAKQAWEKAVALDPRNSQIRNILKEMK